MNIRSAIRKRISVRHYLKKPVPDTILEGVVLSGERSIALDETVSVRFHLVKEGRKLASLMTTLTGTQLLFGSAPHFIVATSEEKPFFMVNMGFRMEQMILYATRESLGTCWIGGMFAEERIANFLSLKRGERVVALTPVGYPDTSLLGRAARNIIEIGAMSFGRRKPLTEIISGNVWGAPLKTGDEELLEVLECTRLSPSWANTQPWRFLVCGNEVIAVADAKGRYGNIRQGKHYYRLDAGIAMSHFFLAAREMGWDGRWHATGLDTAGIAKEHGIPDGYEVIGIYKGRHQVGR